MKRKITLAIIAVAAVLLSVLMKNQSQEQYLTLNGELGTVSEITLYGSNTAISRCENYIKKADSLFSVTNPTSEISRINKGETVTLTEDTAELLELAVKYTDQNSFNPFAGAVFEIWDTSIKTETLPDTNLVGQALTTAFPPSLVLNGNTARLAGRGQKINPGAVAKGYITNKLINIINEENVNSALINLGGNIYAYQRKPNGEPWKIAVRSPENPDDYIGVISAENTAIVTSGDYERSFIAGDERFHHIINPENGYPAKNGLRSITIIAEDAALADILSTKCFVLGIENSIPIIAEYNVMAIFVTEDNRVFFSKRLEGIFEHDNDTYVYSTFG